MVAAGRHRLLQLPRGADKQFDTDRVPIPRHQSLAAHATAAEPERLDDLGADQAVGRRLAPETANPSSVARETLRRQTPEVGAVCPNWARTDLCGGREVTRVPTAKVKFFGVVRSVDDPEQSESAMPKFHSKHAGTVQKARMAVTSAASKEANATTVACLGCRDHAID